MTLSAAQLAKLQKVFDGFDEAGSGHLQFDEFGKLMSTLGRSLTLEKLQEHIARRASEHPDSIPDDAEHISFEFFCYIIASTAKRKLARRSTAQQQHTDLQSFIDRRKAERLSDLNPNLSKVQKKNLYAEFSKLLKEGHENEKTSKLRAPTSEIIASIRSTIDPSITVEFVKKVLKKKKHLTPFAPYV